MSSKTKGKRNSKDKMGYVTVLSKFIFQFVEVAITKSFGVLLPTMMYVFSADASSLGFVCSMPISMMRLSYFPSHDPAALPMAYILKSGRISPRMMAVIGAFISSLGIIIAGYLTSLTALGFCLAFTGIGLSMGYLPSTVLINDYFQDDYVLMNSIGNLGSTVGALVVPVITEKALQAYGFSGAMLILGGITLHAVAASATLRRKESPKKSARIKKEMTCSKESKENIPLIDPNRNDQCTDTTNIVNSDDQPVSPEEISQEDRTEKKHGNVENLSVKQRLWHWIRHSILVEEPLLSLSIPCLFLTSSTLQSWILFLVPRADWHGIPSSKAALLSAIGGGGGIIGRILCLIFLFFGADFIVIFIILGVISSSTLLIDPLVTSFSVMCALAFIQGFCLFSSSLGYAAFVKNSVSNENFAVASGMSGLVIGLGANVGSLFSGMIKDKTGSYSSVFLVLGFINCVTVLITIVFLVAQRRRNRVKLQEERDK